MKQSLLILMAAATALAVEVTPVQQPDGKWGLAIRTGAGNAASQPRPVQFEFAPDGASRLAGYDSVTKTADGLVAKGRLPHGGATFAVEDRWSVTGDVATIHRSVTVTGSSAGGFLSALRLLTEREHQRAQVEYFVPGMMFGSPGNLTESAIGGRLAFDQGGGVVRIREDRMPAPLFGVRFADGSSLTVLNVAPKGGTTLEDAQDVEAKTLIDERFAFGAIGVQPEAKRLACGYWYPGTEGEVTYSGNTYPGGQMKQWRRRYHPVKDGLVQRYAVSFRFAKDATFPAFYRRAWRWAWSVLQPAVARHDIELARRTLIDMLADQVEKTPDGRSGIRNFIEAVEKPNRRRDNKSVMGFTGKTLESAEFLLKEYGRDSGARGARLRALGEAIFDSYVKLKVDPPEGEGFYLDSGKPAPAIPKHGRVYLRSFGDDIKATLRAVHRERAAGRQRQAWLRWCTQFGDWLLTEQQPGGGFPRAWEPGTGRVVDASPQSTYNAIPLLVMLSEETGNAKYREAAVRAGEFAWRNGQDRGVFVGGTIDNPDVIDKEAGTLSAEAYITLYEKTRDGKWLERAQAAANFAETWIFIWNVPMVDADDSAALHWKKGVSTVGLQLISSGHSLVDEYMTFDVDEYAKLSVYAKDTHYKDVARLLLHNTKSMLALPGRTYDLAGPGWQQEHWSLAPRRGYGLHRGWLPWVSTSHLNGIVGLEEFSQALYRELALGK